MTIRVFDCDRIILIAAEHARVIESRVISESQRLFYPRHDATHPSSLTRWAPLAPLAPVCAVTQQHIPSSAVESEKCGSILINMEDLAKKKHTAH